MRTFMRLSNIQGLEIADANIVGTYAPGNECNVWAGLKSREMLMLVRDVALRGLVGMDVVEVAHTLTPRTSVTSTAPVRIIMDALTFTPDRRGR